MTKNDRYVEYFNSISVHELMVSLLSSHLFSLENPLTFFCKDFEEFEAKSEINKELTVSKTGEIAKFEQPQQLFKIRLILNVKEIKELRDQLRKTKPNIKENEVVNESFDCLLFQMVSQIWTKSMYFKCTDKTTRKILILRFVQFCNQISQDPIKLYEELLMPFIADYLKKEKNILPH